MAPRADRPAAAARTPPGAGRRTFRPLPVPLDGRRVGPGRAARPRTDRPTGRRAGRLAGFLRALHRPAPADAPANPLRGVDLAAVDGQFAERLRAIAPTGLATAEVRAAWADAVAAPAWDGPAVWLHGDLHPANVVTADGTLAGVVDFGDLCAGDPATDLSAAWLLLPDGALADFLRAYPDTDPATLRRARGWALLRSLSLIDIGRAGERGLPGGQPTWGPAGRAALRRVLAPG